MKSFQCDRGSEFHNNIVQHYIVQEKGAEIRFSNIEHPWENGLAFSSLFNTTRAIIKHADLPWSFWGKGLIHAAYLHNRRPSSYLKGLSPIQFRAGKPVDYSRLRVFGCPAEIHIRASRRENGKLDDRSERGALAGMSTKGNGWIFYVPSARRSYISLDAVFDESFSSPLALPDLPYQGTIKLRNISHRVLNQEVLTEHTGKPHGTNETFPDDIGLPKPTRENITADISDLVTKTTRSSNDASLYSAQENKNNIHISLQDKTKIHALFTNMAQGTDAIKFSEYLNIAHEQVTQNKNEDKGNDIHINLSDFIPEPKTINQVLKLTPHIKEKWGTAIQKEITGLFDNDTFDTTEKALPADEVIPVKCAFKTKLNAYGGLDKLKARICVRGDMQIKDAVNN